MSNKIKLFFINYKLDIIMFLLSILWINLYIKGYISNNRIITFFLILLLIFFYKLWRDWVEEIDIKYIKNINILIFLINIDIIKLLPLNLIINMYIWLFNLLEWLNNKNYKNNLKINKFIEWIIRSFIINIYLLIIYKFYYFLNILFNIPYQKIYVQKWYVILLSFLIFIPIFNYIYILSGKSIFNIYILLVIISILDDNKDKEKLKEYKYLYKFLDLLDINKRLFFIKKYRDMISMLSILISKYLYIIYDKNSKINEYYFYINYIYDNNIISYRKFNQIDKNKSIYKKYIYTTKYIINYEYCLKESKIIIMENKIYEKYYDTLFRFIMEIEVLSSLNIFLEYKSELKFPSFLILYEFSKEDIIKYTKLDKIIYLISKLILNYYWNLLKLLGLSNEEILKSFFIKQHIDFSLSFWLGNALPKEWNWGGDYTQTLKEINKIIKNEHFYIYKEFYEQLYLYSQLWRFNSLNNKKNLGINYYDYWYINKYIDIYKDVYSVLNVDQFVHYNGPKYEKEINIELKNFWELLTNSWLEESKDLTKENFYKKNYKNLDELNFYVKKEIKEIFF